MGNAVRVADFGGAEMSIRVMTAVFDGDLAPMKRLIMLALADHADDEGKCFPSISRLCQRTGMSERAVQKNIGELIETGHIERRMNEGRKGSNLYILTPAPDAPPHEVHPAPDAPNPRTTCTLTPAPRAPEPSKNHQEPSCVADATQKHIFDFASLILESAPKGGSFDDVQAALRDVDPPEWDAMLIAIREYALQNEGNSPRYIRSAQNFLKDGFWRAYAPKADTSEADAMRAAASRIKAHDASVSGKMDYPGTLCALLIEAGELSQSDAERAGIEL